MLALLIGVIVLIICVGGGYLGHKYHKRKRCESHKGYYLNDHGFCLSGGGGDFVTNYTGADVDCFDTQEEAVLKFQIGRAHV